MYTDIPPKDMISLVPAEDLEKFADYLNNLLHSPIKKSKAEKPKKKF